MQRFARFIAIVLTVVAFFGCKTARKRSDLKSGGSNYQYCDSLDDPAVMSGDGSKEVLGLQLDGGSAPSCRMLSGIPIAGKLSLADLTNEERVLFGEISLRFQQAYDSAVKSGAIKEGYKWVSNWWQGINEICESATGMSPGATSGYKCIDKQNGLINGMLNHCSQKKWCLPKNFRIITVDYNRGGLSEHHFLSVLVERKLEGESYFYYLGNVDPWGNPNDPSILHSSNYDILRPGYESSYHCSMNAFPRCKQ